MLALPSSSCSLRRASCGARRSHRARPGRRGCCAAASSPEPEEDDLTAPWSIGLYHTKRPTHKTDALGRIPPEESLELDNLAALPGWNAEGKLRLAKTVVARDLGVDVEVVSRRLDALRVLLPELGARFDTMRPGDLARLAVVPDVAATIVALRGVFPSCDVGRMVARRPELLLMKVEEVAARAASVRQLLAGEDADAAMAEQPRLLDVEVTRKALGELGRLMPGVDVVRMLARDPSLLSSVDTGEDLILYDNGSLKQLKASLSGGPDAAPDGW